MTSKYAFIILSQPIKDVCVVIIFLSISFVSGLCLFYTRSNSNATNIWILLHCIIIINWWAAKARYIKSNTFTIKIKMFNGDSVQMKTILFIGKANGNPPVFSIYSLQWNCIFSWKVSNSPEAKIPHLTSYDDTLFLQNSVLWKCRCNWNYFFMNLNIYLFKKHYFVVEFL